MATPQPPTQSQTSAAGAIAFLRSLDADGVHSIAAFHANTEKKEFLTFRLHQAEMAQRWVEARIQSCNLYYSLNEPREDLGNNKASKSDITTIRAVALDLDPADGMPLDEARAELQPVLLAVRSHEEHFPTFSVDSGGGYQTVWLLQEKLPADGRAQEVEAQTRGLALHFGGDSAATDVSRLLRLPYTTNFPTKTKLARGRTHPRPAGLIENTENRVSLGDLSELAPPVAAMKRASGAAVDVPIDMDEVRAIACFDDLPEQLKTRFIDDLDTDERLRRLWEGDLSGLGKDTSGSGFSRALSVLLRRSARYTPTEFGQLLYAWDYSSNPKTNIDARYIARTWTRNNAASAEEEFEAVAINDNQPPSPKGFSYVRWRDPPQIVDQPHLIQGLFDLGAMVVTYGDSNVGKTFVVLDQCVAIASGREWNGRKTRKGLVVYVVAEGGRGFFKRVAAFTAHHDVPDIPIAIVPQPVDLHGSRDVGELTATVREAETEFGQKCVMVVVDTLARVMGGGDENTAVDMGTLVKHCDAVRAATGATVNLVHHTGKDKAKGARGSSVLRAATDTEIEIDAGVLKVTKQRDLDRAAPLKFNLAPVTVASEAGHPDITSCVVEWSESPEVEFGTHLSNPQRQALDALASAIEAKANEGEPFAQTATFMEWEKSLARVRGREKGNKQALDRALSPLINCGAVVKTEAGQYLIPPKRR